MHSSEECETESSIVSAAAERLARGLEVAPGVRIVVLGIGDHWQPAVGESVYGALVAVRTGVMGDRWRSPVSDEPAVVGKLLQHIKEIADDFPGDPILAALTSPTPPAPRRAPARAPPRAKPGGNRAGRPRAVQVGGEGSEGSAVGSYKILRAYAVTLTPGKDGTARIDPEGALRFARASNWSQAARPLKQQRAHLMGAMANLASRGDLDKREGVGSYWTWPPGHRGGQGVDPVVAGKSS